MSEQVTTDSTTSTPGTERSGVTQQHPSPDGPGDQWAELEKLLTRIALKSVSAAAASLPEGRAGGFRSIGRDATEALSLIAAARAAPPGDQWRPIETWKPENAAPHWPYMAALIVVDGSVMEGSWKPGNNPPESGEWWPANLDSEYGYKVFPTFWQPLPAPPGEANSKAGRPMEMVVDQAWLARRIENDPELPCEAGTPSVNTELLEAASNVIAAEDRARAKLTEHGFAINLTPEIDALREALSRAQPNTAP